MTRAGQTRVDAAALLGFDLRATRKNAGFTQKALALAVQCNVATIVRLEQGYNAEAATLYRIADVLKDHPHVPLKPQSPRFDPRVDIERRSDAIIITIRWDEEQ